MAGISGRGCSTFLYSTHTKCIQELSYEKSNDYFQNDCKDIRGHEGVRIF
jgi:hypothetical protein